MWVFFKPDLMKKIFLILFSIISTFAFAQQKQAPSIALPDTAWFNFWAGDWDVYFFGKDSVKEFGENHIHRILGDKVLQEEFRVTSGPTKGYEGKSWSVYTRGKWYQTWVDNAAAYLPFTGRLDGEKRIFEQEFTGKDGKKVIQRMVFSNITPNSFKWDWESSKDEGKTWTNMWELFYTRKK